MCDMIFVMIQCVMATASRDGALSAVRRAQDVLSLETLESSFPGDHYQSQRYNANKVGHHMIPNLRVRVSDVMYDV